MSVGSLSCPDVTVWRGPDPTARLSVGASDAVSLSASRHSWGEVLALRKDEGRGRGGVCEFSFLARETAGGSLPAEELWILFVL